MTAAVIHRISKGSRLQDAYPIQTQGPSLSEIDSAFQLQEYIAQMIRMDVHDVNKIVSMPGGANSPGEKSEKKDGEREGQKAGVGLGINMEGLDGGAAVEEKESGGSPNPSGKENSAGVDEACWIYEQLRRLAQDLTHPLITSLQTECTRASCPEMKAGEWLYLCVAHGTGSSGATEVRYQCCAIDYITHTLDSATALLNSPRHFPSRLQIPPASTRHFSALARRLSRIFAHAYYHHREAFEQAEAESSLYERFLLLAQKFDLVPTEFLVTPNAAMGASGGNGAVPERHSIFQQNPAGPAASAAQNQNQNQYYPHQQIQIQPAPAPAPSAPNTASPYPLLSQQTQVNAPTKAPSPRNEGGTISGNGAYNGTAVNRSRTDTMYMQHGFDLTKFAHAPSPGGNGVSVGMERGVQSSRGVDVLPDEHAAGEGMVVDAPPSSTSSSSAPAPPVPAPKSAPEEAGPPQPELASTLPAEDVDEEFDMLDGAGEGGPEEDLSSHPGDTTREDVEVEMALGEKEAEVVPAANASGPRPGSVGEEASAESPNLVGEAGEGDAGVAASKPVGDVDKALAAQVVALDDGEDMELDDDDEADADAMDIGEIRNEHDDKAIDLGAGEDVAKA